MFKILCLLFFLFSYEVKAIYIPSSRSNSVASGFIIYAEDRTEKKVLLTTNDLRGEINEDTNTVLKYPYIEPAPLYLCKKICIRYITSSQYEPDPKVCRYKIIRKATQEEVNKYNSCSFYSVYDINNNKCELSTVAGVILGLLFLAFIIFIFDLIVKFIF